MSLPCSRGWLDLQKFAVDACAGLGSDYSGIAIAIRSELKTLARDVPQVLEVSLLDDTPAANNETQAWLRELVTETPSPVPEAPRDGPPRTVTPPRKLRSSKIIRRPVGIENSRIVTIWRTRL